MFKNENHVNVETCCGGFEAGERFPGVSKSGTKWRARVRHPKLKVDVDLGYYKSPEVAALVVKKKKAEFEMYKSENCVNVETCKDDFNGRQEDVRVETCHGDSGVGKRFNGVIKTGRKWLARVRDPKLKVDVYLGYYESPEAAALVVKKKKAEFKEMFKGENRVNVETCKDDSNGRQEDVRVETCHGDSEDGKCFPGVSKSGRTWRARVRHPKLKVDVDLGCYESPEVAALVVKKKKAELEEMFKSENRVNVETCKDDFNGRQEDVIVETCHGDSGVGKHFPGVCKSGRKWLARIQHPKLKVVVYLGCYKSPEEAALVVNKKKAEFEEMFKTESRVNVETCNSSKVDFKGRESVYRRECGRWGARILHPKLKYNASLGSYKTREEAEVAVANKSAELWKTYGWRAMVKPDCKDSVKVLEEPEHEDESLSEISDELADGLKVPAGVSELKSGKWDARIIDPVSGDRTWLGTFDTAKDAVRSLNKGKAELSAKRKRAEFDGSEFRPKAMPGIEGPVKHECEFYDGCLTSFLGADNLNTIAVDDQLNHEVASVMSENSNSADTSGKSVIGKGKEQKSACVSDFDKAMSLGIINEYGQLLGEYSELDKQMGLSLPDEDADI